MATIKAPKPRNLDRELQQMFGGKGGQALLDWLNTSAQQNAQTSTDNLIALGGRIGAQLDAGGLVGTLTQQAADGLALGGELSTEELRSAQQAARTAYADRGLAMSNPAIAGELLNRAQYQMTREQQRQQLGVQAAALNQAQNAQTLGVLGHASDQSAATAGALMNYGADVNNTNLNMQASMYNSALNNEAALQGAGAYSNSTRNAALIGAGGAIVGGVLIAF